MTPVSKESNHAKFGRIIQRKFGESYQNNCEIWMSKVDLGYVYGQAKLSKEASEHWVFSIIGGAFTGHYRFKNSFDRLSDIPTVFQDYIDKVLEFKTQVWLDDVICATHRTAEDHERELREILSKQQTAGYQSIEKTTELFERELTWLRYHIDQNGVKPVRDKTEAITNLQAPKNTRVEIFLGIT